MHMCAGIHSLRSSYSNNMPSASLSCRHGNIRYGNVQHGMSIVLVILLLFQLVTGVFFSLCFNGPLWHAALIAYCASLKVKSSTNGCIYSLFFLSLYVLNPPAVSVNVLSFPLSWERNTEKKEIEECRYTLAQI